MSDSSRGRRDSNLPPTNLDALQAHFEGVFYAGVAAREKTVGALALNAPEGAVSNKTTQHGNMSV